MWYKNLSRITSSFYGVTFKPGEVKEVPKAINHAKFVQVEAPAEVKLVTPAKPVESIKKPAKVAEPKRKPETKSEPKAKVEQKVKDEPVKEAEPKPEASDSSNK